MKTFVVNPAYATTQGNGTVPAQNTLIAVKGVAIKIEPNAGSFYGPRTLSLGNAAQEIQKMSGSGWVQQKFSSFQFLCELFNQGAILTDSWVVSVAESFDDPSAYSGGGNAWSANYSYNAATGLYTNNGGATGASSVIVSGGQAGTAGSAVTTAPQKSTNRQHINGTATTTASNISGALTGGVGAIQGIVISNTDTTNSLIISADASGNILATITPGQSYTVPFNFDPTSGSLFVKANASTTAYSATAFYG